MEARGAEKAVGVEGRTIGFSQCLPIVSLVTVGIPRAQTIGAQL